MGFICAYLSQITKFDPLHSSLSTFIFLIIFSYSFDLCGQSDEPLYSLSDEYGSLSPEQLLQQQKIDSLLNIGENMFFTESDIIFKNDKGISATAEIIAQGDLLILLKKLDDRYYEIEWDNKIGYIFQYHLRSFNMNTSIDELVEDTHVNVEILTQTEEDASEESYEQAYNIIPTIECNIQFFASQYSDKTFTMLNDLGNIRAITIPDLGITRYHLIPRESSVITCENTLEQIQFRGFKDAFIVE